jgi:hypothetical protein
VSETGNLFVDDYNNRPLLKLTALDKIYIN